jgi:hypothetical protein
MVIRPSNESANFAVSDPAVTDGEGRIGRTVEVERLADHLEFQPLSDVGVGLDAREVEA